MRMLSRFSNFTRAVWALALSALFAGTPVLALEKPGDELLQAGISTKLGAQVDLTLPFVDEQGKPVLFQEVLRDGRPFIVVPAYYHCPRMCGLIMKGVRELVSQLDLKLNEDYRVIAVSFDTEDTPERARSMAAEFRDGVAESSVAERGWRFLTGSDPAVRTFMDQIGFHYTPDQGEFAHSAALMILTPDGQISQYFTGITFSPRDVKLALVEAGRGSIGSAIDHFLLFCFRFDQTKGRYTWAAFNVMRVGGALTLVFLVGLVFFLRRREKLTSQIQ